MESIAYTSGEPSGIGPDIAVIYAQKERDVNLQVYCDPDVLLKRAKLLNLPLSLTENPTQNIGELSIFPVKATQEVIPGKLDPNNAEYVLSLLQEATENTLEKRTRGILTGPINKAVINEAGIEFSGHTEYFAELSNCSKTVMLLATSKLKVALATTHLALKDVPKSITRDLLIEVITIINNDFKFFDLENPRILVCGLNPHAGENGYLGDEEITTISPVIDDLNQNNFNLIGPVPADTAFTPDSLKNIDVVLAMYHDQGLPVLKAKGFKNAANITLGLPFIRTSVDHGTALDLAGTGKIDLGSFYCALSFFKKLVKMAHTPRKRFGQNFLIDDQVINQIISTIAPKSDDSIVEIGPGKGALTFPLAEYLNNLNVIEIDRDLISILSSQNNKKITIFNADALEFNFNHFSKKIRIVGNLPYNISSPLLFHLLNYRENIIDMTFMLQKEVVERIVAPPGTKTYGRLSVVIQALFDTELMFIVPKESFDPQPKIESAILYLKTKSRPLVQDLKPLEEIVKLAFSQRRKTLKNCLKSVLDQSQTDIDLSQRAEMLSLDNFVTLMNDYEKQYRN